MLLLFLAAEAEICYARMSWLMGRLFDLTTCLFSGVIYFSLTLNSDSTWVRTGSGSPGGLVAVFCFFEIRPTSSASPIDYACLTFVMASGGGVAETCTFIGVMISLPSFDFSGRRINCCC